MAELNMTDGDVLDATETDLIDQQMVISCTSSTRPTGIDGRQIFETDTEKVMIYDASAAAWLSVASSRWVSFTPSWSGLSVGNGTQTARYRYTPAGLHVIVRLVFGSTTSVSGLTSITHPNSFSYSSAPIFPYGHAVIIDSGTASTAGLVTYLASTTARVVVFQVSGSNVNTSDLSSTVPHTWASTDEILLNYVVPSA